MNTLSCIDRVKGRTRSSTARIRKAATVIRPAEAPDHDHHPGRTEPRHQHRVKIHYVGYGSNSDEWIRKTDTDTVQARG